MRLRLVALAAAFAALFAFGGTVASQDAQAFAWKDTCRIWVVNRVAQSAVRPILLTQIPPNPVSYATYVATAATGFPTNGKVMFATTGFPITYGCRAYLNINNPGDNVSVSAVAPTSGRNDFTISGNATGRVEQDNDDIEGTVFVAGQPLGEEAGTTEAAALFAKAQHPFAGAPKKPVAPKVPAGILRKGSLGGQGWRKTIKVSDLGRFGALLEASDPKGNCAGDDESEPKPLSGGASLFVRGSGGHAVGELDGRYKTAGQAEATLEAATSPAGIRCLAAALTAPGYKATPVAGPDFGQGGIVTRRVVVKKNGGGFTGYVDVIGLAAGRSNTVLVFFDRGGPANVNHEEAVLAAVAAGLRP